ncbi:integrase catalytic domain-containing protein [Trichonephila clavipes]|nr:integrase catalytic domain-containing protein [Trichonephila clavipes]
MTDPVSLPSDRVKDAAVFEVVGVDLAGLLYVKQGDKIQRITWKLIPPTAAWWGDFWERLARTMKELLRRTFGMAIFTYEELLTILCECEKVVNSRPLTYLSEDMQDLTPIRPARFLFEIPTADTKDLDVRDANHFRKRLRFRAKSSNIQVGDIVLIGDDWKKRLQWPLARVIKLIPGKDGLVRIVKLKTQSCTLIRPIQRVFPLEVSGNDITNPPLQKVQQTDSSASCPNPDTLKATEQPQVTRCGRPVKKPDKLNLLTLIDVFD